MKKTIIACACVTACSSSQETATDTKTRSTAVEKVVPEDK